MSEYCLSINGDLVMDIGQHAMVIHQAKIKKRDDKMAMIRIV